MEKIENYMYTYTDIYESLHCISEIDMILSINYISIKKQKIDNIK